MKCIELSIEKTTDSKHAEFSNYVMSCYDNWEWIYDVKCREDSNKWRMYAHDTAVMKQFLLSACADFGIAIQTLCEREATNEEVRSVLAYSIGDGGKEIGEEFEESRLRFGL
jgi:hypothetical protein